MGLCRLGCIINVLQGAFLPNNAMRRFNTDAATTNMDLLRKKHLSATIKLSEVIIENDAKRKIRDAAFKTAALGHFPPSVMEKPGMVLFLKEIMEEGQSLPENFTADVRVVLSSRKEIKNGVIEVEYELRIRLGNKELPKELMKGVV